MPFITTSTATAEIAWVTWATSATPTSNNIAWDTWTSSTTTSAITTAATTGTGVWGVWIDDCRAIRVSDESDEQARQRVRMYESEVHAQRKADIQREKEFKERKAKANKLLRDALDRKQKKDFDKRQFFYVRGGESGNLYKIKKGRIGNVEVVDSLKRVKQKLCAHPQISCPDEDTMLAQKVMIEHMENQFRDVANITYH